MFFLEEKIKGGVYEDIGHGCAFYEDNGFSELTCSSIYVIRPKREMSKGYSVKFIARCGDMILTGALGLINRYFMLKNKTLD